MSFANPPIARGEAVDDDDRRPGDGLILSSTGATSLLTSSLHRRAGTSPNKVACTFTSAAIGSSVDMTFASLDMSARRIASMLTGAPKRVDRPVFSRGDCVLLWYPPDGSTHELVAAFWGCLYAGAVAVIVDDAQTLHRVQQDTQAVLGLTTSSFLRQRKLDKVKDALHLTKLFHRKKNDKLRQSFMQTFATFDDHSADVSRAASRVVWLPADRAPAISEATSSRIVEHASSFGASTVACIVYTAGSSDVHRKPVQVSHANLAAAGGAPFDWIQPTDCVVTTLPLHTPSALVHAVIVPVVHGCRSVVVSTREMETDPCRWMDVVASERAVLASASPSTIAAAAASRRATNSISRSGTSVVDRRHLSSLVSVMSIGGPLHPTTMERFIHAFHLRPSQVACGFAVGEAMGMVTSTTRTTEPPHVLAVSRRVLEQCHQLEPLDATAETHHVDLDAVVLGSDTLPDNSSSDSKDVMLLTSSGWPLPHMSVIVVDPVSCIQLPEGLIGEIWVHGPSLSPGYLHHPASHHQYKFTQGTLHVPSTRRSKHSLRHTGRPGLKSPLATVDPTLAPLTYHRTGDLGALYLGELYVVGRAVDVLQLPDRWLTPYVVETSVRHCSALVSHVCVYGDRDMAVVVVETKSDIQHARDGPVVAHSLCNAVIKCVVAHHDLHVGKVVVIKPNAMPLTACGKVQRGRVKALVTAQDPTAVVLEYHHYPTIEVPVGGASEGFLI
ncbi:hypothetical protein H310_12539 [Aphanomyces invadans]|uniref:AMP-dependent synthetase/ligase domain-containing protein n=1 Tax=Aphanomyces invadans TaxID=157072 RepID=A0A024TH60_9STRA|nr:hypothetical protein H310_12539 [Aphanomyces invadans]ETV93495.1 hypothetical protein H310_12539 [Aphanomyces invadans]|eukprot:XP_008877837.1 hypothetical protein H310_12539 [Aphanomyces invadans]